MLLYVFLIFAVTAIISELRAENDSLRAAKDRIESEMKQLVGKVSLPSSSVQVGEPQPGLFALITIVHICINIYSIYSYCISRKSGEHFI